MLDKIRQLERLLDPSENDYLSALRERIHPIRGKVSLGEYSWDSEGDGYRYGDWNRGRYGNGNGIGDGYRYGDGYEYGYGNGLGDGLGYGLGFGYGFGFGGYGNGDLGSDGDGCKYVSLDGDGI